MRTGIKIIDEQHQLLIDLVKDFEHAINENKDDFFIEETLEKLINYVSYHFKAEEELMAHHNYPDFNHHKENHDDLVKKVIDFHERCKKKELNMESEVLCFLKEWIVNHITKSDMEYVPYIN